MKQIILDTNFLLIPSQFGVDVFSEIDRIVLERHELCVLDKSIDELQKIMQVGSGRDKAAAKIGLCLAETKKLRILGSTASYVDSTLIEMCRKDKHIVCTQDQGLKKKLKEKGIAVITLRKKEYLILVNA